MYSWMNSWKKLDQAGRKWFYIKATEDTTAVFYSAPGWGDDHSSLISLDFDQQHQQLLFRFAAHYDPGAISSEVNTDFDSMDESSAIFLSSEQAKELIIILEEQLPHFQALPRAESINLEEIPTEKYPVYGLDTLKPEPGDKLFTQQIMIPALASKKINVIWLSSEAGLLKISSTQFPEPLAGKYVDYIDHSIGIVRFSKGDVGIFCAGIKSIVNTLKDVSSLDEGDD